MKCNLERFLEQQELECRRIARSCHDASREEWLKTAEFLLARRREHVAVCEKCGKD